MSLDGPVSGRMDPRASARVARGAALASIGTAAVLVIAKAFAAAASGSVAILASLADSGLDLVASLFTLWAVNRASAPPDERYAFGYGKAESFAALAQAVLVGASAALVGREAILRLSEPAPPENGAIALWVMVVSVVLTAGLIAFQSRAVARTGSIAVKGDRTHYAADLGSNLVVLAGVALSAAPGLAGADAWAGIVVALWLAWGGIGVARGALDQLMDREAPDAARGRILELVRESTGREAHRLRTRISGPILHVQFHLDVPAAMSLRDAHSIMVDCERRILAEFPGADILIHPDPEDAAEPHAADFFRDAPGRRGRTGEGS